LSTWASLKSGLDFKMRRTLTLLLVWGALLGTASWGQDQPVDSTQPFSPFNFGQILSMGLSLSYFYYNEDISLDDDIASFGNGSNQPFQVIGTPKSTESGTEVGISASAAFYSWRNRLFFRPKAELLLGIGNTYDGSSQGQPLVDSGRTVGLQFSSIKGNKNNFFLFAGCDVGYSFPFFKFPFVIYTGIDYGWWYRDLTFSQDNTIYIGAAGNVETYTRYALPVGVFCATPISPEFAVGFDARVDWMFFGQMKETVNTGSSDSTVDFPVVTLGNRGLVRLEVFLQRKLNEHVSVKYAPYALFYSFGKSNTDVSTATTSSGTTFQQAFFEPTSNSFLVGITVSLDFLGKRYR
jgi:hypothetical protein